MLSGGMNRKVFSLSPGTLPCTVIIHRVGLLSGASKNGCCPRPHDTSVSGNPSRFSLGP